MMRRPLQFALLAGFMLASFACADHVTETVIVPYPPEPAGIDNVIPADPVTADNVHAGQRWTNPILVVHSTGIELLGSVPSHGGPYMGVAQVEKALNDLPIAAWPWGRTVEVQVDAQTAGPEQTAILTELKAMLGAHHVLVYW